MPQGRLISYAIKWAPSGGVGDDVMKWGDVVCGAESRGLHIQVLCQYSYTM